MTVQSDTLHTIDARLSAGVRIPGRRLRRDVIAWSSAILAGWDGVATVASGCLTALLYIRFFLSPQTPAFFIEDARNLSLLGGLMAVLILGQGAGLLDQASQYRSLSSATRACCGRLMLLLGAILAVLFLTRAGVRIPRLWIVGWGCAIGLCTVGSRVAFLLQLRALEARGVVRERVAIIGAGDAACRLVARLRADRGPSLEVIGIFDEAAEIAREGAAFSQLIALGKRAQLDWVIVASTVHMPQQLSAIVHTLKALNVGVALCLPILEHALPNTENFDMGRTPMTLLVNRPIGSYGLLAKGLFDRLAALCALVLLAPLLVAVAAGVRADSPGPALFRQRRHGLNNTEFEVLKFRTMRTAAPGASDGRMQTRLADNRITRLGAFLRRSSIDELPQLINVLRGEMSIVGPRPHPCEMRTADMLGYDIVAEYAHRHRVKPGLTGWAQVNGHRGATETPDQVRRRVEFDLHYIENWSFLLDLRIIVMTPVKLLFPEGRAF